MLSEATLPKTASIFGNLKTTSWIDSKSAPLLQLALDRSRVIRPFLSANQNPRLTLQNFTFHGSAAQFNYAFLKSTKKVVPFGSAQEKQLENIRGFYDPPTDKIHLRTNSSIGLALRLAIHRLGKSVFRATFGASLADGLNLHFTNLVLAEHGLAPMHPEQYTEQLRCAKNLIGLVGFAVAAKAYFDNHTDLVRRLTLNLHTGPISSTAVTGGALCKPEFDLEKFKQRCKGFFKDYELNFFGQPVKYGMFNNKQLSQKVRTERIRDENLIITPLRERLEQRAKLALASPSFVPIAFAPLTQEQRQAVVNLSAPQFDLYIKWFGGPKGINFAAAQQSFEMFANGELRFPFEPEHEGLFEPDGADLFLFAEFGFLCVEIGDRKPFWEQMLKIFVETQEIFMHVYRDDPKSPPPAVNAQFVPRTQFERRFMSSFSFKKFRQIGSSVNVGAGQSDINRKIALRQKYNHMDVEALKQAEHDNLRRAQLMP